MKARSKSTQIDASRQRACLTRPYKLEGQIKSSHICTEGQQTIFIRDG